MAAAGVALRLFDQLRGTSYVKVAEDWFSGFFQKRLVVASEDRIESVSMFYDPDIDHAVGN